MTEKKSELAKARDAARARARRRADVIGERIEKAAAKGGSGLAESLEPIAKELATLLAEEHQRANEADLRAAVVEKSVALPEGTFVIMPDDENTTLTFHGLTREEKTDLVKQYGNRIADSFDADIYPNEGERMSKSARDRRWPTWGRSTSGTVGADGKVEGVANNVAAMEKRGVADVTKLISDMLAKPGNSGGVVLR